MASLCRLVSAIAGAICERTCLGLMFAGLLMRGRKMMARTMAAMIRISFAPENMLDAATTKAALRQCV